MTDVSARAAAAKRLLEDPVLIEALDAVEQTAITAWRNTSLADEEGRTRAWYALKASERLRVELQGMVVDGQFAARRMVAPR